VKLGEPGPQLLRPGAISLQTLAERFGVRPESMLEPDNHDDTDLIAPGMMKEHYCPTTKLVLLDQPVSSGAESDIRQARVGRIAFHKISAAEAERYAAVETLSSEGDLREVAHHLFAALRRLDSEGLDAIHCDTCEPQGLGHAIMDRLKRAAARGATT
jgi:L-threonylcarbamoyladenylate synthase